MKTLEALFNYFYIMHRSNKKYEVGNIISTKDKCCNRILVHITDLGYITVKESITYPSRLCEYNVECPRILVDSNMINIEDHFTVEAFVNIFGYNQEGFNHPTMQQKLTMLKEAFSGTRSLF